MFGFFRNLKDTLLYWYVHFKICVINLDLEMLPFFSIGEVNQKYSKYSIVWKYLEFRLRFRDKLYVICI